MIGLTKRLACLIVAALGAFMIGGMAIAQVQPTAEQMRMINQLPPAQREQALDALRQMQSPGSGETQLSTITEEELTDTNFPKPEVDEPKEVIRRAAPRTRIVITFTTKPTLSPSDKIVVDKDPVLMQLQGSHHFTLDDSGVLSLMGLQSVPVLGLTEDAIVDRLSAESLFAPFDIRARILEVQPIGVEALKPFGYDLFEQDGVGFDPPMAGPVPPDYVLGTGDTIRVQLFGNVNGIFEFSVSRDGVLNLPELGPVTVSGLTFLQFREDLKNRVNEMLIGTQVSVTMGQLRTIRVFVLGDANRPGSYVVSSLATMSSALYRSGGLSEIGSMRNISLKRKGKTIATLDLYELLLKGDTSGDQRLQSGDVLFIPPIGSTVSIGGAVRRPAIYEIKSGTSVDDILRIAGGTTSEAFLNAVRLERIDGERGRIVLSIDAASSPGRSTALIGGDTLVVPSVLPEVNDAVVLIGNVQRPGSYEWRNGMRLTDIVPSALDLTPGADASYILIRRENSVDRSISILSADLGAALRDPKSDDNIELHAKDTVHVFSLAFGRQRVIASILDELRLQSQFGSPHSQVSISGRIRAAGAYPLEPAMRVSDLIRAGGSMDEGAYGLRAELARFSVVNGEYRSKDIVDIDLDAIIRGDMSADIALEAHDHLSISLLPDWYTDWSVTIEGEVRFPGEYQVLRGESLTQLVQRAGGLTEHAFPEGAIFLRESLKEREREQIELLAARMEADLTSLSLETLDTTGAEALTTGESLLDQLRNAEPVGRLVIDVEQMTNRVGADARVRDIELRDGDQLLVPMSSQEVTVIGEAQQPTSHLFQPGFTRDDYIELSGGLTRRADEKLIYVVRASGAVIASERSRWFGRGGQSEIRPGDTIVIPLETDRIRPLTFWTNVTQILYQGAIAVAAIQTFSR